MARTCERNRFHLNVHALYIYCQQKESHADHQNWIEQHSKPDSYLIQRFYSQLLRYNWPANGKEGGETFVFAGKRYIETVMRDTSNACMQSCTKSYYSLEYSICVNWPKVVDIK